jgi:hypothetical protein
MVLEVDMFRPAVHVGWFCTQLTVREALNAGIDEEMARDKNVIMMGA